MATTAWTAIIEMNQKDGTIHMKKKTIDSRSKTYCADLFEDAQRRIPGGVNSPVRAFGGVGGTPRFIREAHGSRMIDVDGIELVEQVGSWGPLILGHAHPEVTEALREAIGRGTSFGCPTELESEMAELVQVYALTAE